MSTTLPLPPAMVEVRDWVLERNPDRPRMDLLPTTPIIKDRWLTSLQLPELLLFLEQLRGAPVDPATLAAGAFRDLQTIHDRFIAVGRP